MQEARYSHKSSPGYQKCLANTGTQISSPAWRGPERPVKVNRASGKPAPVPEAQGDLRPQSEVRELLTRTKETREGGGINPNRLLGLVLGEREIQVQVSTLLPPLSSGALLLSHHGLVGVRPHHVPEAEMSQPQTVAGSPDPASAPQEETRSGLAGAGTNTRDHPSATSEVTARTVTVATGAPAALVGQELAAGTGCSPAPQPALFRPAPARSPARCTDVDTPTGPWASPRAPPTGSRSPGALGLAELRPRTGGS